MNGIEWLYINIRYVCFVCERLHSAHPLLPVQILTIVQLFICLPKAIIFSLSLERLKRASIQCNDNTIYWHIHHIFWHAHFSAYQNHEIQEFTIFKMWVCKCMADTNKHTCHQKTGMVNICMLSVNGKEIPIEFDSGFFPLEMCLATFIDTEEWYIKYLK